MSFQITNTGGNSIRLHNIFADLVLGDTYHFQGTGIGAREHATDFISELKPLDSCTLYIYFNLPYTVAEQVINDAYIKIGFTDDFSPKVVKNGIDNFDHCDDVFIIR